LLDGLRCAEIADGSPQDAESRKDWLALQPEDRFHPQPYEQLAKALRTSGKIAAATEILVEKERQYARESGHSIIQFFWYRVFGPSIDYGYRPWKALWLILVGTVVFGLATIGDADVQVMTPTKKDAYHKDNSLRPEHPQLNVLVYSIDAFVPLIDLHQAKNWHPSGNRGYTLCEKGPFVLRTGNLLRLYLWLHTIAGWTLTTLFVVGLTGIVRR